MRFLRHLAIVLALVAAIVGAAVTWQPAGPTGVAGAALVSQGRHGGVAIVRPGSSTRRVASLTPAGLGKLRETKRGGQGLNLANFQILVRATLLQSVVIGVVVMINVAYRRRRRARMLRRA